MQHLSMGLCPSSLVPLSFVNRLLKSMHAYLILAIPIGLVGLFFVLGVGISVDV